jgi:CheY-like chemotaxis protein
MHEEPYDVGALLNDVAMLTKLRIQGKDIQFTADISYRLPSIMIGDEIRIRQILNNLLSNAAKYTEKGSIKLSAHSQDAENNEITVTFKVSDTGIGILPKDISRLFSDYCRLEDSLAAGVEGTGLGLSITRRLCRNMGGDVAVSSAFRRGSEFTATIKQKVNPDVLSLGSLKFSPTDFATADINFTLENFRVLSVDDNEMNLVVLEGLFSTYQATVVSCLGGREALKAIQEQPFDLIFLDYIMPDLDGIQTAAAIRDMGGRFLSLPLIALTADADLGSEETFLKNGFNDFLPKPLDMNSLHQIILKWAPLEKRKIKFDFVNSDLGPIQDKAQPSPSSTPKPDFKILKFGNR